MGAVPGQEVRAPFSQFVSSCWVCTFALEHPSPEVEEISSEGSSFNFNSGSEVPFPELSLLNLFVQVVRSPSMPARGTDHGAFANPAHELEVSIRHDACPQR